MKQQSIEWGHCKSASELLTVPVPLCQSRTGLPYGLQGFFIWCHSFWTINSIYFYCRLPIWSSALNKLVVSIQYKVDKWSRCRSYHHNWCSLLKRPGVCGQRSGNHKKRARMERGSLHLCAQCHCFLRVSKIIQYHGLGSMSTKFTPAGKRKIEELKETNQRRQIKASEWQS